MIGFRSTLEFSEQIATLVRDGGYASINGRVFATGPNLGFLHPSLQELGTILVQQWSTVGEWKTACIYDAITGEPIKAMEVSSGALKGGHDSEGEREDEFKRVCNAFKRDVQREVWRRAKGQSDIETDRAVFFNKFPHQAKRTFYDVKDVVEHYIEHQSFRESYYDWVDIVTVGNLSLSDELRIIYDRDALLDEITREIVVAEGARLRLQFADWNNLVRKHKLEIEDKCAERVKIGAAVENLGVRPKTLKAVYKGGQEIEVKVDEIFGRASGFKDELDWTPRIWNRNLPDFETFEGFKYRGKWIYERDAA